MFDPASHSAAAPKSREGVYPFAPARVVRRLRGTLPIFAALVLAFGARPVSADAAPDLRSTDGRAVVEEAGSGGERMLMPASGPQPLSAPVLDDTTDAWRDPSVSRSERVQDLIARLTTEEKIAILRFDSPGVPRLGIPAYNWWNEGLHGVARSGRATVFPQAINMAATFDDALVYELATAESDEARAKFNAAQRLGNRGQYAGLTYWSPNINIFRDLRWGRGHETYGEDPTLTSRIGIAFVRGLQGEDPGYLKAAAAAKHYAVHSGPEALRHGFDAEVSGKELEETYLPAFQALVEQAHVAGVMCAYNRINGVPACADRALLTDSLRQSWGFDGYVTSDCGAVSDIVSGHHYAEDRAGAAAAAIRAGVDVNCGSVYAGGLAPALEQGLAAPSDLDTALAHALSILFRLGLFDPPSSVPWSDLGPEVVASEAHANLARRAAQESMVLLKNDGTLPLSPALPSLAVVGPTAASLEAMLGNYNGLNDGIATIVEGIAGAVDAGTTIEFQEGVPLTREDVQPSGWAVSQSQEKAAIVAVVGLSPLLEGEAGDARGSDVNSVLELPPGQVNLIRRLRSDYDGPLVVVVTGGSPRSIPEIYDMADAVLWVGYPGQEGGRAVADILFGHAVPGGRLPVTVPRETSDVPPYADYDMTGRTYRFATAPPLFPFGFGLSYTTFEYDDLVLDRERVGPGEDVRVTVTVTNTGRRKADEVVQLYVTDEEATVRVPNASLVDFQRVTLLPGASRRVELRLPSNRLEVVDEDGSRRYESGWFTVTAGGASPGARAQELGAAEPAPARLELR